MRDKLNENPQMQIIFVVVLLVATGYLLMTRVLGGSDPAPAPGAAAVTTDPTTGAALPATSTAATIDPATGAPVPVAAATSTSVPATIPPPKPVVNAYEDGKTVILLVIRGGGIDDRLAADSVRRLEGRSDVAVFVTNAKHVAKYAAIAQGVGLDRVPALVVISPKSVNDGGPAKAVVTYGLQDATSVEQAVNDAVYEGPDVGYAPD